MGFSIEIRGTAQVVERLQKLDARVTEPPWPLFRSLTEDWTARFRANIEEQHEVGGGPFVALSAETRRRRAKAGFAPDAPILQRQGYLRQSVGLLEMTPERLRVGSSRRGAALLQFGGRTSPASRVPNRPVPPRPFIGLTDEMLDETVQLAALYFTGGGEFDA